MSDTLQMLRREYHRIHVDPSFEIVVLFSMLGLVLTMLFL